MINLLAGALPLALDKSIYHHSLQVYVTPKACRPLVFQNLKRTFSKMTSCGVTITVKTRVSEVTREKFLKDGVVSQRESILCLNGEEEHTLSLVTMFTEQTRQITVLILDIPRISSTNFIPIIYQSHSQGLLSVLYLNLTMDIYIFLEDRRCFRLMEGLTLFLGNGLNQLARFSPTSLSQSTAFSIIRKMTN